MGNSQTKELLDGIHKSQKVDLSQKLSSTEYINHLRGVHIERSLVDIPYEAFSSSTISLFEEINLAFNSLTHIQEDFGIKAPHLRILNISHNWLITLPQSFCLLLHLRKLDVSYNKFESIPDSITLLARLECLNVSNNKLRDLPSRPMPELISLNASHNNLRVLPDSIIHCKKLKLIVTNGNHLIHPPQAICDQGSKFTLDFLQKNYHITNMKTPSGPSSKQSGIFMRIRGQQVMASVWNPESASREYQQAQGGGKTNKRKCPLMLPEDATRLAPDQLKDRILGLVYGACIGDAICLNSDSLSKDECLFFYSKEDFSLEDRIKDLLRSYFPPCDWSSNADVMLLTLESFMRWGGVVDELELASEVIQWKVHGLANVDSYPGYPLSSLMQLVIQSSGFSVQPHAAARSVHDKVTEELKTNYSLDINPADNSCLPSAVVLGIPNFHMVNEVIMNVDRICQATHASPLARVAAALISLIISIILKGDLTYDIEQLVENLKTCLMLSDLIDDEQALKCFKLMTTFEPLKRPSNDVCFTVRYVLQALAECDKGFKENILEVAMRGGEGVSAHGCVIGGVLGAHLGYSKLPQDWLNQLPKDNIAFVNSKMNHLMDLFGLP